MSFKTKKIRKMFPRKGPEKKTLMFLSNLLRIKGSKRKAIYKKVLKSKNASDRAILIKARKVASSRKNIFNSFSNLVKKYRDEYPSFEGVIIFGGVVKKETPPTDLDFIFVGELPQKAKKTFCDKLVNLTGVPANPFPVKINLREDPKQFEKLLSIPYLHAPEEWTVQNFVGPNQFRRKLLGAYKKALKNTGVSRTKVAS